MDDCLFCKIVSGDVPASKIYEDENSLAFLDISPVNPGHALLIPKEHYKNIYDTPDELLANIAPKIKKIALAVKEAVNADGINIGMNNDPAAGQIVFHTHIHIIPRFEGDGHNPWSSKKYEEGEMAEIAEKIRAHCNQGEL